MRTRYILALLFIAVPMAVCSATDRWFDDIVATSPDGQWKVEARSPDNRLTGYHPWKDDFVYSAFKGQGGVPVWTRHQSKQESHEDSPVRVVVADDAWVAIQTGCDQLVFVDPTGRNRGRVDDLKTRLPKVDRKDLAVESSAGLIWSPYSLWYYLTVKERHLFVIRLWWGHRLVFDPETGRAIHETGAFDKIADRHEIARALALLGQYEGDPVEDSTAKSVLLGAHLAGSLQIADAVPILRNLEQSEYIGTTSVRFSDARDGTIDPFSFQEHSIRQVSQLSLRRLGETPVSLPVFEFSRHGQRGFVRPDALPVPRDDRIPVVKRKMSVQQVLDILGSPDFIELDGWEFDIGGASPRTIIIEWKRGRVSRIVESPPKWKNDLTRDKSIVLF